MQPTYLNFSDGTHESEEGDLYEPYNKNGKEQPKLLTGKEKISELQQILEDKNLEINEMQIQAESDNQGNVTQV